MVFIDPVCSCSRSAIAVTVAIAVAVAVVTVAAAVGAVGGGGGRGREEQARPAYRGRVILLSEEDGAHCVNSGEVRQDGRQGKARLSHPKSVLQRLVKSLINHPTKVSVKSSE